MREHDCLDQSGVIFCPEVGTTPLVAGEAPEYPWQDGVITDDDVALMGDDYDVRECRACHRRFRARCNFEDDFS